MGFRARKSVNFGGFRINFSKSGVGYSYGCRGARVTHTAKGTIRKTLFVPGTGIYWVSETGKKKVKNSNQQNVNNQILVKKIESNSAEQLVSAQEIEFIKAIKKYRLVNKILNFVTMIDFIITIAVFSNKPYYDLTVFAWLVIFVMMMYFKFAKKVKVEYSFDEYGLEKKELVKQIVLKMNDINTIWQVNDVYKNQSAKVNAGAKSSLDTSQVRIKRKKPSFLITNVEVFYIKLKKEEVYIFPDKFLIINGRKIGAIHYDDLQIKIANTNFIVNYAPKDANVVGYTWLYVNKDGGPDRRYKNNVKLAICNVGTIEFNAPEGLNVVLYLSNIYTTLDISNLLTDKNI